MNVFAILPILPAIGGVIWVLSAVIGLALSILHPRGWKLWLLVARSQWRGLLVLSAVGLAACGVWTLRPRAATPLVTQPFHLPRDLWPTIQGSLTRQGGDRSRVPHRGGILWTARPEYEFLGAPAVAGDVIVAIGNARGSARCFCWDALTGREVWSGAPSDYRLTLASPVLAEGLIYCGEGVHHTPRSRLLCLDPARGAQPVLWQFATDSHVECTPVYSGGKLYVAAGDDGVYCLAPPQVLSPTAAPPSATIVWHAPGADVPDAETALAVHDGRVYVGLGFETHALVMLDAKTGAELRRVALPLPMLASPALFAGGLLCGLGPGALLDAATAGPGEVRLVELDTLETRWSTSLSASMVQWATIDGDVVYVVSADGQVHRLDAEGRILNTWRAPAPVLAGPALAEDCVYVVAQDGVLTGLSREALEPQWSVRLGDPGNYFASPVIHRGRVYLGTPSGFVCVGPTGARE